MRCPLTCAASGWCNAPDPTYITRVRIVAGYTKNAVLVLHCHLARQQTGLAALTLVLWVSTMVASSIFLGSPPTPPRTATGNPRTGQLTGAWGGAVRAAACHWRANGCRKLGTHDVPGAIDFLGQCGLRVGGETGWEHEMTQCIKEALLWPCRYQRCLSNDEGMDADAGDEGQTPAEAAVTLSGPGLRGWETGATGAN